MDEKERIEKIMATEGLNATQFAVEIGIQSSTLSHILNGRNKPSLEVIKRILNRFRAINSDWLMLGIGSMYRSGKQAQQSLAFDIKPQLPSKNIEQKKTVPADEAQKPSLSTQEKPQTELQPPKSAAPAAKSITRIIVFYSDNSFDELVRQ